MHSAGAPPYRPVLQHQGFGMDASIARGTGKLHYISRES